MRVCVTTAVLVLATSLAFPCTAWAETWRGLTVGRRHGIAPVPRSHPAYRYMRDGDGVVCE